MKQPPQLFDRALEWAVLSRFLQRPEPGLAIVRGRRRHGKSVLLRALADASGALYHQAIRGVGVDQRRDLAETWQRHVGGPRPAFATWSETLTALLRLDAPAVILDELPYLTESAPELESVLQRALDERRSEGTSAGPALVLCGSARAVMTRLLVGDAPLRGRAQVELDVGPFGYREAARFTGLPPPVALVVDAVVGGVPGYLVDLLDRTYPETADDVLGWLTDVVAAPTRPLIHEARSMVELEAGVRDPSTYVSVLAALAGGATRVGEVAGLLGRTADAVSHGLRTLETLGLAERREDLLRRGRPTWRVADPLLRAYVALFRSRWTLVEQRDHDRLARTIAAPWRAQILGPHLEELARTWARRHASEETLGGIPVEVGAGTIDEPRRRIRHEVDLVALDVDGRVLALGETKLRRLGHGDYERLVRLRALLVAEGRADERTRLILCSAEGIDPDTAAHTVAVDLQRLYEGE